MIVPPGISQNSLVRWMNASPVLPDFTAAIGSGEKAKMVGMTHMPAVKAAVVSAKQVVTAVSMMSSRFFT